MMYFNKGLSVDLFMAFGYPLHKSAMSLKLSLGLHFRRKLTNNTSKVTKGWSFVTHHLESCLPGPLSWNQQTPLCAQHQYEHMPAWLPQPEVTLACRWPLGPLCGFHVSSVCWPSGMLSQAALCWTKEEFRHAVVRYLRAVVCQVQIKAHLAPGYLGPLILSDAGYPLQNNHELYSVSHFSLHWNYCPRSSLLDIWQRFSPWTAPCFLFTYRYRTGYSYAWLSDSHLQLLHYTLLL